MTSKYGLKRIWYPGSAFADTEWIIHLYNEFKGVWYYTDINEFQWGEDIAPAASRRQVHDTFAVNTSFNNITFDTLVISNHHGLKTVISVIESGLLEMFKPNSLIYTSTRDIYQISESVSDGELFAENSNYLLSKIIVIPSITRIYSIYQRK